MKRHTILQLVGRNPAPLRRAAPGLPAWPWPGLPRGTERGAMGILDPLGMPGTEGDPPQTCAKVYNASIPPLSLPAAPST